MQILPLPVLPTPAASLPPQTIASVLPQVQGQAVAPISQQAIAPTPKSEKGEKDRVHDEKDPPEQEKPDSEKSGGHVNISV